MKRKQLGRRWPLVVLLVALVLPASVLISARVAASTAMQAAPSPVGKAGTVLAQTLNVRAAPALTGSVVGQLKRSNRVEVVGQEGEWLQIAFPAGPGGKGWVSARFIAVDGVRQAATPAPSQPQVLQVPAPEPVSYRAPNFAWRWLGNANALRNIDWYFDLRVYRGTAQDAFLALPVKLADATYTNGIYSARAPAFKAPCGTYWLVQIAERRNGRFVGWISPESERQLIGDPCRSSGGTGGNGGNGGENGGGNDDGDNGGDDGGSGVPGDLDGDGVCDTDCGGQLPGDGGNGVPGDTDGDGVCDIDCGD